MKEYIIGVPERTGVEDPAMVPAIIQRELVRCKDCKHRSDIMYDYYGNPNNKVYVCQINDLAKKPDWFCADGERE